MSALVTSPALREAGLRPELHEGVVRSLAWKSTLARVSFLGAFTAAAGLIGSAAMTMAATVHLGRPFDAEAPGFAPYAPVAVCAAVVRAVLFLAARPDQNRRRKGYVDEVVEAAKTSVLGSLAVTFFTFYWRGGTRYRSFSYARSVFVLDWVLATVGLVALTVVAKWTLGWLRSRGHDLRTVVVVGDSRSAEAFVRSVANRPETGYCVVGRVSAGGERGVDFVDRVIATAGASPVDELVLALPACGRADLDRLVAAPELRKVRVRAVPELFDVAPAKVSLGMMADFPLLSMLDEPLPGRRRYLKRAGDLVVATAALVVASPLMLGVALAVRLSSPGPVLFRQERVGMDGRRFRMLKLRTMVAGADSRAHERYVAGLIGGELRPAAKLNKLVDDPRVTAVGRVLRRLSIDELPQLLNVLKGDMSLVGPRPALPYEVARYDDWHRRRLEVRPGVTGLWQVSGRSRLTFEEMIHLDVHYIENWTPLTDLKIVLRTVPAVLRREAA